MTQSVQRFLAFAFASADVLIEVGEEGKVTFAMGACRAMLGVEDAKLVGRRFGELFDPVDRGTVEAATRGLWPGARRGPILAVLAHRPQGSPPRKAALHACRLPGQRAAFSCTLSLANVASAEEAAGRRVDPTTGLLDGRSFAEAAGEAVKAAREAGDDVGMSLIDIPALSAVTRGDPAKGEGLARRVGDLLRAASMDGASVGRIAESRFGVVTRAGGADLERCLESIKREGRRAGVEVKVDVTSIPLASDHLTEDETVKAVRFAVNRFAALPKGESMDAATLDGMFDRLLESTRERMTSFVRVIRDNEFALTYQPVVEIATAKLHHFEVLTRFGDGGSPFETIKFAEEIDLISRFDLAVLVRSINVMNQTLGSNPGLAVNVSGRSVADPAFTRVLLDIASKHKHLAGRLNFELTESAELEDLDKADTCVRELRQNGFSVYLDDFGAGAAAFRYLQALHVDGVKIDGDYIKRLSDTVRDHTILVGMVRMCRGIGLETVAERVEDRDTAVGVYEMGVRYGQGWYYGKPLTEPLWLPGPGLPVASHADPPAQAEAGATAARPAASFETVRTAKRRGETATWG